MPCFGLLAVLAALAVFAIAALGARLASGPIQLTWLAPYVERAIRRLTDGFGSRSATPCCASASDRVVELVGDGRAGQGAERRAAGRAAGDRGRHQPAGAAPARHAGAGLARGAGAAPGARPQPGRQRSVCAGCRRPAGRPGRAARSPSTALLEPLLSGDPSQPLSYLRAAAHLGRAAGARGPA